MRRSGGRALWVHTDVAQPASVRALLSETRNRFGRVDLLVNNAGAGGNFSRVGEVMRDHRDNFAAVLAANFLGPWEAIVAAREILRSQAGGGSIVNVSTHYADHPYLFRTIYTVSKILLKTLAKAARVDLSADGISISDVAPTLIAGPRMEWVMRNYATKFTAGFDDFPGLSPAARKVLTDLFLRSFDGALSPGEREAAARSFLAALRAQKMPKDARERIESWYGRIVEWFRSTVPATPPRNEEVAEAVLFAAKDGRFLENPFLAITTLPPFSSFPPSPGPVRVLSGGEPGHDHLHRRRRNVAPPPARVALRKWGPCDVDHRRGVARRSGADPPARRASVREGRPGTGGGDAAARSRPVRSARRRAVARQRARRRAAAGVRRPDRRRHGGGGKGVLDGTGEDRTAIPWKNPKNGHPVRRVRARGAGRRSPRGRRASGTDRARACWCWPPCGRPSGRSSPSSTSSPLRNRSASPSSPGTVRGRSGKRNER